MSAVEIVRQEQGIVPAVSRAFCTIQRKAAQYSEQVQHEHCLKGVAEESARRAGMGKPTSGSAG
jgi:hypothetical protein